MIRRVGNAQLKLPLPGEVAGVLTLRNQYAIFNAMKLSLSDRRKAAGRRTAQNARGMRVGRAAVQHERAKI